MRTRSLLKTLGVAVAVVLVVPASSWAQRREVRREIGEGTREVRRERREAVREIASADSAWEARHEIREGVREVRRERIERRHEVRREIREHYWDWD
jgi:predicted Holliday junction resolvase-like endonuclease